MRYGRVAPIPPWLISTLVFGGGVVAGALISRTAMAAMAPQPTPAPTPKPGPEPTPTTKPIRLVAEKTKDAVGNLTARLVSDDPRFLPGQRPEDAFIVGSVPVRVMVSVPEWFSPPSLVNAGRGNRLLIGRPGSSRDFLFSIKQYAWTNEAGAVTKDKYSAIVSANFATVAAAHYVPLRIFAIRG